ncbi:HAD family phosphatase [Candidatus Micrarchaeota archaeon]|nr:HAD family phosphatase [Candidatus Micrarchaeota archaeon]
MKAAFFDLTGTLLKESSIPQYIRFLAKAGFLDRKTLGHLEKIHEEHKKHHLTELQNSQKILRELAHALQGESKRKFDEANRRFMKEEKMPLYPYTQKLLSEMKAKGYTLVAVSGAFEDVVKPAAGVLGLDSAFGSRLEVQNGKFTGRLALDLTQPHQKRKIVEAYAHARNGVLKQCWAFGDMVLDEEMFRAVGHPVALNAGPALKRECRQNGWPSVKEIQVVKWVDKTA